MISVWVLKLLRSEDRRWRRGYARGLLLTATVLAAGAIGTSPAVAAFTREATGRITQTPAGPVARPLGVAVDSGGDVWTSEEESPPFRLSQFSGGGGAFTKSLSIEGLAPPSEGLIRPESVAIDHVSNDFYVTGSPITPDEASSVEVFSSTGTYLRRWPVSRFAHVAVDNSSSAAKGDVYVAASTGLTAGLQRFNAQGEPSSFSGSGPCLHENKLDNAIRGVPSSGGTSCELFHGIESLRSVAVDGEGNLFVSDITYAEGKSAVLEYRPSGAFVQAFVGTATPGIGESRERGGFGGEIQGITVDPVSNHLLVAVLHYVVKEGQKEPTGAVVDEFDVASGAYLSQISERSAAGGSTQPLADVNEITSDVSGNVYVADIADGAVEVYGPGHFLPSVRTLEPTSRTTTSATLNGSVNVEAALNPEKAGLTSCQFEYVTESAFKVSGFATASHVACEPPAGSLPINSVFNNVHVGIGGLTSGVTYEYRLVATTGGALGGTSVGGTVAFTAPAAPRVVSTSAGNISSQFVDLHAGVNPLGAGTTYHFEYDTQAYAGSEEHGTRVPVADVSIGAGGPSGNSVEAVVQSVGGLKAGVLYHFRVVASNEIGTTVGPDTIFMTQPQSVSSLPDGRQYELVTPARKLGGSDMFGSPLLNNEFTNTDAGVPDEEGDGFVFSTHAAFGPFPGNEESGYVFKRSGSGWGFTSLASPTLGVQNILGSVVFNKTDLSEVAVNDEVGSIASEQGARRTLLTGAPGGPYATIATDPATNETTEKRSTIVGASEDLGKLVVETPSHVLCSGAGAVKHGETLCAWNGSTFELVDATSEGTLLNTCGAVLGAGGGAGLEHNAVSADGSRVLFTSPQPSLIGAGSGCWSVNGAEEKSAPQLYMRVDGKTLRVSGAGSGVVDASGSHYALYAGASADDSRIYFISEGWLTTDHPTGHDTELYECEVVETEGAPACDLSRVSAGEAGSSGTLEGGGVYTVPAVSEDGTVIYFTATGTLAPGAATYPTASGDSSVNLYRYDAVLHKTTFVATVSAADYSHAAAECEVPVMGIRALCTEANWYTTPNGRYLTFASSRELTGQSTKGSCTLPSSKIAPTGHCDEVYRYDSGSNSVVCVSCNSSGAGPVSNAEFARSFSSAPSAAPVKAMSEDGAYVFFDSADPLVPGDSNASLDVYEWHDGAVSVLSGATDSGPSYFLGMSALHTSDGLVEAGNVFIGTHAALLPSDTDSSGDIYDARICTPSSPCIKPAASGTAQCEGDACQVPPTAPAYVAPPSLTVQGAGNTGTSVTVVPPSHQAKKVVKKVKASKLSVALKQCRKRPKKARHACEVSARRRYGGAAKKGSGVKGSSHGR